MIQWVHESQWHEEEVIVSKLVWNLYFTMFTATVYSVHCYH